MCVCIFCLTMCFIFFSTKFFFFFFPTQNIYFFSTQNILYFLTPVFVLTVFLDRSAKAALPPPQHALHTDPVQTTQPTGGHSPSGKKEGGWSWIRSWQCVSPTPSVEVRSMVPSISLVKMCLETIHVVRLKTMTCFQ